MQYIKQKSKRKSYIRQLSGCYDRSAKALVIKMFVLTDVTKLFWLIVQRRN